MELTQGMIDARADRIISGQYKPELPGLDLVFFSLSLADKGAAARAYSSRLKELFDAGGYFSEYAIPTVLRKVCRDNGLDPSAPAKKRAITERLYKELPEEYVGPYDQLTPDEVALLSPEAAADRERGVRERGERITTWMTGFYNDADREILAAAEQVERLEAHLRAHTAEHLARKHQMETEILLGSRRDDDPAAPYFGSLEEIQMLPDRVLMQLYMRWKEWREGLAPNFTSPS